jgi:flagellar biosynthetic protein FliR
MVLNQPEILAWLGHFLWPFLRVTGLFLTAPLYSSPLIPVQVKAVMAAMYAAALAVWLPNLPPFPGDPIAAIFAGALQIAYGAAIGLAAQMVVYAIAGAGEIAGLSMGLGFAELQFREATTATPVLYDIMFWVATMAFFAANGPVWVFAALAHSFAGGIGIGDFGNYSGLLGLGGTLISAAVAIAMPVIAVALCVNITVGLLSVFAPQLNVLTIGFPLLILVGLWMLGASTGYFSPDFLRLMRQAMDATAQLIHG